MIVDVLKLVYEFFVNGKIWAALATVIVGCSAYLLYVNVGLEVACTIGVGLSLIILILKLPQLMANISAKEHRLNNKYRRVVSKILRHDLKKALAELNGRRIFVTEGHNGTASFGDLSFLYMDITYMETAVPNDWLNFEYKNLSTTFFTGFDWIAKHGLFYGHIDQVKEFDSRLANLIHSNGTNYLIASSLYDGHNECIGTIVLTFDKEPENVTAIVCEFQKLANKAERLLAKQWSISELEEMVDNLH